MTKEETIIIGEIATTLTRLQELHPDLVRAAGTLWLMYARNGGWELRNNLRK